MEVQPNLLAVNSTPSVLASRGAPADENETEVAFEAGQSENQIAPGFFVSPLLRFDSEALAVLFQIRDPQSGEVTRQFPRESVVEELRQTRGQAEDIELVGQSDSDVDEAPPIELATGPSSSDASSTGSSTGEAEATVVVNGSATNNGAPVVGGTPGAAAGLAPGSQGVDVLV